MFILIIIIFGIAFLIRFSYKTKLEYHQSLNPDQYIKRNDYLELEEKLKSLSPEEMDKLVAECTLENLNEWKKNKGK